MAVIGKQQIQRLAASGSRTARRSREAQPDARLVLQRAQVAPGSLRPADILQLQRTIGNRATGRLLSSAPTVQAKMEVGPVNDVHEQEANRVAREVVRRTSSPQVVQENGVTEMQRQPLAAQISGVQRAEEDELEMKREPIQRAEEDELEMKREPIQRAEEDELEMKREPIQRAEEDELEMKRETVQRAEEDELEMKRETVQRAEEDELEMKREPDPSYREGGALDGGIEQSIRRAKGGGQSLEPGVQRQMESGFGASFGGVRIHRDAMADKLTRSVQAKAFTTGKDIFFKRGEYNPGSRAGKELLAHELTHTVQQGAAGVQRQTYRPAVRPTSTPSVQRFVTKEAAIKLAGKPSQKANIKSSTYIQILNLLDMYQDASNKKEILGQLITLCQNWLDKHDDKSVRGRFIMGLRQEAQARKVLAADKIDENLQAMDGAPSLRAAAQEEREANAANPDWADPALEDSPADKYIFTIAVATAFDDLLDFAKARAHSTKRNKIRGALTHTPLFGIRGSKKAGEGDKVIKRGLFKLAAPKNNQAIKEKAARQVLESKKEEASDDAIAKIADRSSDVGHTWVKFRKMVGSQTKEVYSYGMWPEVGFGHPSKPVPGRIRHPDITHEKAPGEKQLFMDVEVSASSFQKGLARAIARLHEKPNYTLSDYNCTAFAKEIAGVVGVSFPSAATVFPAEASKGFRQSILSPNRLFTTMEGMKEKGKGKGDIYSESSTADLLEDAKNAEAAREEEEQMVAIEEELAAYQQYDVTQGVDFWPGEQFGDLDTVRFSPYDENRSVWSMNQQRDFYDPDTGGERSFSKVKAVIRGSLQVGWIRSDRIELAD